MESLIQKFLNNLLDLCLVRLGRFPESIRGKLDRWADTLRNAYRKSNLAKAIAVALEELRADSNELAEVLIAEIEAVVEIQEHALRLPDVAANQSPVTQKSDSTSRAQSRALKASATLLGSLREAVWYLPDWAKGLLKVGEELVDILGPAR